MIFGVTPFGVVPLGVGEEDAAETEAPPINQLIIDPRADVVYLIELYPFQAN